MPLGGKPMLPFPAAPDQLTLATDEALEAAFRAFIAAIIAEFMPAQQSAALGNVARTVAAPVTTTSGAKWTWMVDRDYVVLGGVSLTGGPTLCVTRDGSVYGDYNSATPSKIQPASGLVLMVGFNSETTCRIPIYKGEVLSFSSNTAGMWELSLQPLQ